MNYRTKADARGQSCDVFFVSEFLQLLATKSVRRCLGGIGVAAIGAVSADFKTAHHDVEAAVALDLSLEPIEEIALEFRDLATTKTSHVNMVALWAPLVIMLLSLHVHQVEFVDQAMPLKQAQRAVYG